MNKENSSVNRQASIYTYASLIETIAKQEYYRIEDTRIEYKTIARLAALTVRIALLSGRAININMLACLIRDTIRQELGIYYSV